MKFCIIFLVASCLGEKDSIHSEKGINQNPINYESESETITIDDDLNEGPNIDKKFLNALFENSLERYRSKVYNTDDGNPDIHGKIERPCQSYDTFCIRKFFAEHSRCKISGRAVPDPLFRAQLTVNYPNVNMSATQLNVEYSGLNNAIVEEFYINKVTDNLVITLNFPLVSIYSNNTFLKFYLKGREPVLTRDFGRISTISFSITVVIPQLNDLRLDEAEITPYLNTPVQPFVVGPGLAASTDPEVMAMLAAFFANANLDQREGVLTESSFYAANYIQYNICDFGLKVL